MTKRTIKNRVKVPDDIAAAIAEIAPSLHFERGPEPDVKAQRLVGKLLDTLKSRYDFKKKDLADLISRRTGVRITTAHLNDNISSDNENYEPQALMVLAALGLDVVVSIDVKTPKGEVSDEEA